MSILNVKIVSKTDDSAEYWEGTVSVPGLKPTKVTKSDGTTRFNSRSTLLSAVRNRAKSLGFEGVDYGENAEVATARKAAKKTARTAGTSDSPPSN